MSEWLYEFIAWLYSGMDVDYETNVWLFLSEESKVLSAEKQ